MTGGMDRRKTSDVLWMALVCARDWKLSLIDSIDNSTDPDTRELWKDIRAIRRLQRGLFGTDKTALDVEIAKAKLVSLSFLRALVDRDEEESPEPCGHPGCFSHVTHPCEGCGRIAGKSPDAEQGGKGDDHELD